MSGFAGVALRKVMETIRSTYYPADYQTGNRPTSTRRPFTRARIAQPGEGTKPPMPRTIKPAYYEMSQNFRNARQRFWALLLLTLVLLGFFIACFGLNIYFGR